MMKFIVLSEGFPLRMGFKKQRHMKPEGRIRSVREEGEPWYIYSQTVTHELQFNLKGHRVLMSGHWRKL